MTHLQYLIKVCFIFLFSYASWAQHPFYAVDSIQSIEVHMSQPNWDYRMDTAKLGTDSYILADRILINGKRYDSVGIKFKGNSSFDSTYKKNPIHIALDEFKEQSYEGIKDIKLGNGYADPSMVREVLGYQILQNYMHSPQSNFAKLYINGTYIGLYSNDQNIDKDFCSEHFYSSKYTFVKCNPIVKPGPTTKSSLRYLSEDPAAYYNYYEMKSDTGWQDLVHLCDTVSNHPAAIDKILDIDRVLWMLAFNNVTVNLDSYSGVFAQNYYLYKDKTKHFNPIVWDLNMAFGGFPYLGSGNSSMGSLSIADMQQLPLAIHNSDSYWPLIKAVMASPQYKRMYAAHARTIINEFFSNQKYSTMASELQSLIDDAVHSDTNTFFTYAQFKNALTASSTLGSYSVPGLSTLMNTRASYLLNTPELLSDPPTITKVVPLGQVKVDSSLTITTKLSNASIVYLGYRVDKELKFTKIPMYDDGQHQDSLVGDGLYGASFIMTGLTAQYYVYAENASAGVFAPARAEHEFYNLKAQSRELHKGEVVINEFLAVNQLYGVDETGKREDWIELYNNTEETIDLFGNYLSDSKTNLVKFTFPKNSVILPKSYLMLWADEDASTASYIHASFKLSGSGESLYLSSHAGAVLDSITFGTQVADVSVGRCPNGIGDFGTITYPTFKRANDCTVGSVEEALSQHFMLSPNPANELLNIYKNGNTGPVQASVSNTQGQVLKQELISNTITWNTSAWPEGLYILKIGTQCEKVFIRH